MSQKISHKEPPFRDASAVQQARQYMENLGLEAYSLHAPFRRETDITSLDENRRRESVDEVRRPADCAASLRGIIRNLA